MSLPTKISGLSSQTVKFTIQPGATYAVNLAGQYFYFVEANGDLFVQIPGMAKNPHSVGTGQRVEADSFFDRLEVINETDKVITAKIFVGILDGYIDNRFNLVNDRGMVERKTRLIAWDETSIGAGLTVDFDGAFNVPLIHRKALLVTNEDSTQKLYILDSEGNRAMTVFRESQVMVPTSDALKVQNPNPSALTVSISELVYV